MDGDMLIAVPAAVLGAAGFGLATAAQQRATHEVEKAGTLNPRLITSLLRRPMWLLGLLATIVALLLQRSPWCSRCWSPAWCSRRRSRR
jgi:hypothetical protein